MKFFNPKIAEEIVLEALKQKVTSKKELLQVERDTLRKYGLPLPKGPELFEAYQNLLKRRVVEKSVSLEKVLKFNPIRSLSGVATISILTPGLACKNTCLYCPTEEEMPKSYFSTEPAVKRAIMCDFDPKKQVKARLYSLKVNGHSTDKIELIILGGTFSHLDPERRKKFVKQALDALNGCNSPNLEKAQEINESAPSRCIGLTIETRPDSITEREIINLRELGVTRVELGVQTIYDDVLKTIKRGHLVDKTIKATFLLREAGFKVGYHLMPGLPGSNTKRDLEMFKTVFTNPDFKPDYLKIYPCVVVEKSELYEWWEKGLFAPVKQKEMVELLIEIKKIVPYYLRISRLFRDIPSFQIKAGVNLSNLRQLVQAELKKRGLRCNCIRCREPREKLITEIQLFRQDYEAARGKEVFLSFEDPERRHLIAFLRLRQPAYLKNYSKPLFDSLSDSAIVRELHTYGEALPIGKKSKALQHQGLGKKLLFEAEKIAQKEWGVNKIAVISGVGVREYYRSLGYQLKDTYMVKEL